jgi:hypothetical protein
LLYGGEANMATVSLQVIAFTKKNAFNTLIKIE